MFPRNCIKLPRFSLTAREISSAVIYDKWHTLFLFFWSEYLNVECSSSFSSSKMNVLDSFKVMDPACQYIIIKIH